VAFGDFLTRPRPGRQPVAEPAPEAASA
jgi:hypothetical protein